ncbi:MAG TPA: hypothetical protein VED40_08125 [Azospirillaceae bacterium]|nr:hypothetical protein [Azospirillaceae bacterium]
MKKIIFFALALMVLIGAGVGGWIMFGPKPEGEGGEQAEEVKKKPSGPPQFVTLDPVILPVIGNKRVEQNVMLIIAVEVADDASKDIVRAVQPRLRDAYIRALYGSIGRDQVIEGQIINVASLESKLREATESVLGKDIAQDVLIQAVSQRPAF